MAIHPSPFADAVPEAAPSRVQTWGLLLGLGAAAVLVFSAPSLGQHFGLAPSIFRLIAVTLWMGIWWVTEAIPIGATALLPAAVFPLFGIASAKALAPAYGSPVILLLLGGFLLALAVEASGVHRRIALYVLLLVGTSPRRLVLGFVLTAAFLSMWISNTATALIMLPIAGALADRAVVGTDSKPRGFQVALFLATAYGASVGGMGTPVGTPPNLMAIGAMETFFPNREPMHFLAWMGLALPVLALMLPLVYLALTRVYPRVPKALGLGNRALIQQELQTLGAVRLDERRAVAVFGLAALLWITRSDLRLSADLIVPGWESLFGLTGTHDGTVAVMVACLAFMVPSGRPNGEKLLTWSMARFAPWDLVLLFGGGMALSTGFLSTGFSDVLGESLSSLARGSQSWFYAGMVFVVIFATELVSNTALAGIIMPILAATAEGLGAAPEKFLVPAAMACSCAFMMPAATGPNAIAFGSGRVRIAEMVRAGFLVNCVAGAVLLLVG